MLADFVMSLIDNVAVIVQNLNAEPPVASSYHGHPHKCSEYKRTNDILLSAFIYQKM